MRSSWFFSLAALALAGCGASTDTGSGTEPSTAPSTDTIVVTTTTWPPLTAGPVQAWGGWPVLDVCVSSEQSYPQVPDYRFDIEGLLRELLAPTGITVVAAGEPCSATLSIVMSLEGRPAEYKDLGTVYSGMLRRFDMALEAPEATPLTYHHETDQQPGELASSLDPTDPRSFLEHYEDVWGTISLEALVQFWGPAVAIELLNDDVHMVQAFSQLCETAGYPLGECEPTDYNEWRAWYEANFPGQA
jgi:hypothetical protein